MAPNNDSKWSPAYEAALLGMLLGVLFAAKHVLDFIPNVELVSLLLIVYARHLGRKTYLIALAFAALECFVWGLTIWSVMYFYVWPILVALTLLIQKKAGESLTAHCALSGLFGLSFGALCSIPYIFVSGPAAAFGWWLAGLTFDAIHGVSNFVVCLVLFKPLDQLFNRFLNRSSA